MFPDKAARMFPEEEACMFPEVLFEIRGVKPGATTKLEALTGVGFVLLPETLRCPRCEQRYFLMADFTRLEEVPENAVDLDGAVRSLFDKVLMEHAQGHREEDVYVVCERETETKMAAN